ncbi:MAG: AAA family ATPase [Rhodopirellula sp.]|nr:AAA family ATPase [Rhodopirellula sp.]
MAKNRYIPQELPLATRNNPKFRAEVVVYDELKSQLDATQRDWTVVHQAKWLLKEPGNGEPKEGEADFVMAHPKRGVLVVDVKGGLILLNKDGQWKSRDRYRMEHDIDPFGQVARNARNLAKKFNELAFWKGASVNRLGRLVVFPDSAMPANAVFPSDVSRDIVIDKAMLANLADRVLTAASFWFGPSWPHPRASRSCETLVFLFATPLEFTDSLGANLPLETRSFEKLTDDQFRVVQAAAKLPRVAVRGGAGSGKTWLARKRAIQLHAEGFRTLLLCRSEPLADHLRSMTKTDNNLVIAAYSQLLEVVFRQDRNTHVAPLEPEYGWKLLELAEQAPDSRFEAIMVDEGQDFCADEWVFVEGLLRDAKRDVLYVFVDDNQQIYGHETSLPEGMIELHLGDNVRTTRSIHVRLQNFYQADPPQRPLGPLGRKVRDVEQSNDERQSVKHIVRDLMEKDQIGVDDIVVLTPRKVDESQLCDLTLTHGRKLSPKPRSGVDVRLASVQDFKGLENAVVVLAEADCLPSDKAARTRFCYTAYSRPRSHLIVIGNWH